MNSASSDDLFRTAAESEGGVPVSGGARQSHVRSAVHAGRAFLVDLLNVREERRLLVVE